jgi:hypothetical protein
MINFKPPGQAVRALIISTYFLTTSAAATSIYIDFDQPIGGPGVPLNTYSAAAPMAGTWNGVLAKDGVYGSATVAGALFDISGTALPGVFVDLGGSTGIQPTVNAPSTLGTHQALLGDYFDTSLAPAPPWVLQINGITNGTYDIYVYAPSDPNLTTSAWSFPTGAPQTDIAGSTDSVLNLGIDYLLVQTTVTNNSLVLSSGSVGGIAAPSGLAGIQLLQVSAVPVPGAIWLFGSGLLGMVGMAIRKKAT